MRMEIYFFSFFKQKYSAIYIFNCSFIANVGNFSVKSSKNRPQVHTRLDLTVKKMYI